MKINVALLQFKLNIKTKALSRWANFELFGAKILILKPLKKFFLRSSSLMILQNNFTGSLLTTKTMNSHNISEFVALVINLKQLAASQEKAKKIAR